MATTQEGGFAFMLRRDISGNDTSGVSFILDSGASDHLINNENLFSDFVQLEPPIQIAVAKCGEYIYATKKGIVRLRNHLLHELTLEDVLFCPEIPENLLSVKRMQDAGMSVEFHPGGCKISKGNQVIINGKYKHNIPIIEFGLVHGLAYLSGIDRADVYRLWHERLGHISKGKFLEMKRKDMFDDTGVLEGVQPDDRLCEACVNGKQARLRFAKFKNKEHIGRPLFVVHSDVCGPITPATIDGRNYYVVFIDQYTHYCVTYLIANKSDVFMIFKDFVAKSEAHFNLRVVNLYIDNGREYLSNSMREYCVEKGISYHLTVPHTPQLNGVSERMIRTITEKARAMVYGAGLQKTFWGEAVLTATYLINRSPSVVLKEYMKTPYEMCHDRKPNLKCLKIFGSTVYVHDKTRKRKFDGKSCKGILVGYEPNGYKILDMKSGKFIIARDVIVDETNMKNSRSVVENGTIRFDIPNESTEYVPNDSRKCVQIDMPDDSTGVSSIDLSDNAQKSKELMSVEQPNNILSMNGNVDSIVTANTELDTHRVELEDSRVGIRRSQRLKDRPHVSYGDFMDNCVMNAHTLFDSIPRSFEEIMNRDDRVHWEEAIREELDSHFYNGTWTLVQKPDDRNIVDCRWVFTIKHDEFGKPVRYKARLVARGFTQEYMVDYDETFAPVARIQSFRILMSFSNQFGLKVHHMDVKTAFLNGVLKEEIYMSTPQGLSCDSGSVCRLNKAIYGLKQAARCWFEVFEHALKEIGFTDSSVDRCIYILDNGDVLRNIYVLLYVDDLVIATADIGRMNDFKSYLMRKFRMTDLLEIRYFIGIRIDREDDGLYLSQCAYIESVLRKFGMVECKPIASPLPAKLDYEALNSDDMCDAPCRSLIGCLMYIMLCTRPDLSTAINILSRYSHKGNMELWQCLKRVLRYLKGTIGLRLAYVSNSDYKDLLIGYVDSDWGGSESDRRSTTGFLFKMFDSNLICWNTRKQNSVAASSTEAEYMALFEAVREALWLKSLLNGLRINLDGPIRLFEDNQGCISMANNPSCHKRSKHIDIKYLFSREQVENKIIKVAYISTDKQIADILTKSLPGPQFIYLRSQLGLKN